jgi:rubrerythrin
MISESELWVLSYYRASELAGALLFGRLARRTRNDELRVFLTQHFAEEAHHAWLWTETIGRVGKTPLPLTETYQSAYGREIGLPSSMPEVLLLTEVFEGRIRFQFQRHAAMPDVHEVVKQTLLQMLDEEEKHVGWVMQRLEEYAASGEIDLPRLREQYQRIDERIYGEVVQYERRLWDFLGR